MIVIRTLLGLVVGSAAASLVAGVIFAWGNAFVMWSGWLIIAPMVGALCGCVVVVWVARGTHGEPARPPRRVPVLRNPAMTAQGMRLLNDVSAATIRAQRARCCGGTGLADYAAVPCPNPDCPVERR